MNITEEQKLKLRQCFPEVFNEGKIDFEKLKLALGEDVDTGRERFGMNWPGKADSIRVAQMPTTATLKPVRDASVDFDTTENLFIEGDNLEVLKLLQKSYFGKIKMIYIDPPYNTGKEFIYPDKYEEGLKTYLQYTGQIDAEGKKFTSNTETDGRYHSKWMDMMWPRLFLARNLLTEDGVIFISIDDHEVENLKKICNEVFGEENFVAQFVWEKMYTTKNDAATVSISHEYILCFCKSADLIKVGLLPRTVEMDARYTNPDNDSRGVWKSVPMYARGETKNGRFPIKSISGADHFPPPDSHWRYPEIDVQKLLNDNKIYFGQDGNAQPNLKRFLFEVQQGLTAKTLWFYSEVGSNDSAKKEIKDLFGTPPFDFPKPTTLIKRMLKLSTEQHDIVLDFFAGSATTAHSIFTENFEDNGNRRFILVQLPESCDEDSEAFKAGYKNIAEIGEERIRRAGKKILEENKDKEGFDAETFDKGFKVYRLSESSFTVWDGEDKDNLQKKLELHVNNVVAGSTEEDILNELLLKAGYSLTEKVTEEMVGGKKVYSMENGAVLVCLEKKLGKDAMKEIVGKKPKLLICLNSGFDKDEDLTNTAKLAENANVEFRTV